MRHGLRLILLVRKSSSIFVLLLFAAIVSPNALRAQTIYDWTDAGTSATGDPVSAFGTITTNIVGGVDVVVAGSGIFNGDSISLIEGNGTGSIQLSPLVQLLYDNQLYPTSPILLDVYGLLFKNNVNGDEFNIYWTGPGWSVYSVLEGSSHTSFSAGNFGTEFSITPAPTPEPATWSLMLIGFGLLLVMRNRAALRFPRAAYPSSTGTNSCGRES